MTADKTIEVVMKKAFIMSLAEEYAKSTHSSFADFLYDVLIYGCYGTYLPNYVQDVDLLKTAVNYNLSQIMDDALE